MNQSSAASLPFVVHLRHSASGLSLSYHVATHDSGVDVGAIAAHFSLEPNSLRFNGHFISRGSNFISGLTWRELLTYFQSRGLQWGSHPHNPVEIQGRPLLQIPNKDGSAFNPLVLCHDKLQSGKRLGLELSIMSPSKRRKQDRDLGVLVQTSPYKLKRHILADESTSCSPQKRAQHEMNPGVQEGANEYPHYECEASRGLKRQGSSDEVCTESSLWKRLKEVKV